MAIALVIEDNQNNMILINDILVFYGYTVIQAESGKMGYQLAEEHQPDFIVLDIQLQDTHGLKVLKKIRGNNKTAHIPVIAMASYAMTGDKEKFLAAGCNGYIEKPINSGSVMDQIKKAISEVS